MRLCAKKPLSASVLLGGQAHQHHPHPAWQIQEQLLIGIRGVGQRSIQAVETTKLRRIRMQQQLVIPGARHWYR